MARLNARKIMSKAIKSLNQCMLSSSSTVCSITSSMLMPDNNRGIEKGKSRMGVSISLKEKSVNKKVVKVPSEHKPIPQAKTSNKI